MKFAILHNIGLHPSVYQEGVIDKMKALVPELDERIYTYTDLVSNPSLFSDTEIIFSSWGMPALSEDEIKNYLPNLKCVFYAAGSVQRFARPFLNCGVRVFSAWAANAIPVAEYTVAQIILANKGFFTLSRLLSEKKLDEARNIKHSYSGNYKEKIGLIGCGMIGSHVARLLQQYELEVMVFDPFLSDERAEKLKVKKCSLDEIFKTCSVVSNHMANNEQTKSMLTYSHFAVMRPFAAFINTGRGEQVVEADLVRALTERADLTAVLDVTYPEPAKPEHPFYTLPNCFLTPHIAGNIVAGEQVRMVEYMLEEYRCYASGAPCKYEVNLEMLKTMA